VPPEKMIEDCMGFYEIPLMMPFKKSISQDIDNFLFLFSIIPLTVRHFKIQDISDAL